MDRGTPVFGHGREVGVVTEATDRLTEGNDRIDELQKRPFPSYSKYRDSGVEWLGEIPAHWHLKRLKHSVARLESGGTPESGNVEYWTDDEHGIPWVAISDISRDYRLHVTAKRITEQGRQSKRLRILPKGTLLYSMYASLGKVALLETEATINQAILGIVTRENEVLRDYLRWWFEFMQAHVRMLSSSNTQDNLSAERVRNMPIVLPIAIKEQHAIAGFLDHETTRIDALVARKERLIELLQEKRIALITRAVTRGLDANAPMKDSDVEWLGEIPAHWVTWKATHGFRRIGSGTTPKSNNPEYYNGDIAWVTTSELRETVIVDTEKKVTATAVRENPTLRKYPKGTLLFAMYGATIGRLGILGIASTVNQACAAFAEPLHFITRFVYYWLQMRRPTLIVHSAGGGQPNLSQDDLRQLRIPAPPMDEQRAIADVLDHETTRIDILIGKVHEAIDDLNEFRAALISAAVTGKIDVREEAS